MGNRRGQKLRSYQFAAALLLAFVLPLLSCTGGSAGSLQAAPGIAAPARAGGDSLPAISGLPPARLSAASIALVKEPLAASLGALPDGDGLALQSGAGRTEWAIWGWYGFSEQDYPRSAELSFSEVSGEYYLALADYDSGRWKFSGPHSADNLSLETAALSERCIGSGGTFYLALFSHDASACRLESISLESGPALPAAASQPWLSASLDHSPQFIQLDWSEPLRPGQSIYRWATDEPEEQALLLSVEREELSCLDDSADYGRYYYYRICTEQDGLRSAMSPRALGRRSLPPAGSSIAGHIRYDAQHAAAGVEVYLAELNLYDSTGPDGRYCFNGLPDGSYNIWCMKTDPPLHIGLTQLQGLDSAAETLTLPLYGTPRPDWYWLYPPLDPQVEELSQGSLKLSWSPARYATGYRVYRSRFASLADLRLVGESSTCSIVLSGEPGGDNYYCLRSIEEDGEFFRCSEPGPGAHCHSIPLGLLPDSIYAVAEQTLVDRGTEVLITVYARDTAEPLRNLNMLRLSFETGNRYVSGSFNIGAPGNLAYYPDGVWTSAVAPEGFLSTPESFLKENDLGTGRSCIDFNITPLYGVEVIHNASGALFNFRLKVNRHTNISFIRSDTVARTFYTGLEDSPLHWANDLNEGQPPILVRE